MSKDSRMVGSKGVRFPSAHGNTFSQRGFALVLVLSFMVLLTIVVIAYLLSATNQNSIAHNVENTSEGKRLSDVAVQVVMGQIRQATSGGTAIAWASQPGMIRTFGNSNGTASGQPLAYYKLYSSDNMVVSQAQISNFSFANEVPSGSTGWQTQPAIYTDLNAPALSASNVLEYPIIDPAAALTPSGGIASASNPSLVEGCTIPENSSGVGTAPSIYTGSSPSATNNPAPMPVKWIYVLQDGTLTAPTGIDATGQIANWNSATDPTKVPSAANPIVARIAFWTDDETCKLNLNTAAGNNFWDTPTFDTGVEFQFERYGPTANEFTRYPGHPSTTSLKPVLWSYGGLSSPDYSLFPAITPPLSTATQGNVNALASPDPAALSATATAYFQKLFNLNPREAWGGSLGGTTNTMYGGNTLAVSALNTARLFASVDEMLFAPPRINLASGVTNQFTFANSDINKLRFFLTTSSRAPEVNMFNLPKISMWPVHDITATPTITWNWSQGTGTSSQSPYDRLLTFCSTINNNAFYFTRNDPNSLTADLSTATVGGKRNLALYNYLETMLGQNIPGYGASFQSRYGTLGDEQILTETYDYIRSAINLCDGTNYNIDTSHPFKFAFAPPYSNSWTTYTTPNMGQVAPIQYPTGAAISPPNPNNATNNTKGIGRFPTIKQVALMFIAQAANQPPVMGVSSNMQWNTANTTFNPMHPWVGVPTTLKTTKNADGTTSLAITNSSGSNAMYPAYPSYTPGASNTGMINPQNRQTHAGFPYCYDLLDTNGAFTEVNTRYQGPSPAYDYYSTASTNPIYGGAGGSANLTTAAPGVLPAPSALQPYQTQIQAKLLIDPVDNAPGFVPLGLNYQITVTFVDTLQADGNSLGFTNATEAATCLSGTMGDSGYYNIGAMQHTFLRQTNSSGQYELNFVSQPVVVGGATGTDPTGQTFQFSGGRVTLTIQPVDQAGVAIGTAQTINLNFPAATFPTPLLAIQPPGINTYNDFAANSWANFPPQNIYDLTPSWMLTFDADPTTSVNPFAPLSTNPNFGTGSTSLYPAGWSRFICPSNNGNYNNSPAQYLFMPQWPLGVLPTDKVGYFKLTADTVRSLEAAYGDTRVIAALQNVPSSFFVPHKYYYDTTMRSAHSFRSNGKLMRSTFDAFSQGSTATLLTNALQLNPSAVNFYYYNYVWFGKPTTATQEIQNVVVGIPVGNGSEVGSNGVSSFAETTSMCDFNNSDPYWTSNTSWAALPKFSTIWANGGDFDNGPDHEGDGPFINKPDEGFDTNVTSTYNLYYPAYEEQNYQSYGTGLFPPNRQVSSPVLFGSLPVILDKSVTSLSNLTPSNAFFWRTLLFSPNPNSQTHPSVITQAPNLSAGTYTYTPNPPDFTYLDFFNMPVVEPYAISEPFSTAGRVNMNYQIAPFTYIKRDTAMRGVLRSTMMTAVPDSWIYYYKSSANGGTFGDNGGPFDKQSAATGYFNFRYPISPTQTLMQFDAKFANGDIFRSPSEISSIWLYPAMQATASAPTNPATPLVTYDSASQNIQNWWYSNPGNTADLTGQQCRKSLTGTNMRDRPYADIYPQLTTKSNSYTVHYRVQVLKKIPTTPANEWIENQDQIYSEYRGSSLIERYIDPNNTSIPDFATTYPTSIQGNATPQALDNYYYYHVLSVRKFSP